MKAGCNVFAPSIIGNPGWFSSIYSPEESGKSACRARWNGKLEE